MSSVVAPWSLCRRCRSRRHRSRVAVIALHCSLPPANAHGTPSRSELQLAISGAGRGRRSEPLGAGRSSVQACRHVAASSGVVMYDLLSGFADDDISSVGAARFLGHGVARLVEALPAAVALREIMEIKSCSRLVEVVCGLMVRSSCRGVPREGHPMPLCYGHGAPCCCHPSQLPLWVRTFSPPLVLLPAPAAAPCLG